MGTTTLFGTGAAGAVADRVGAGIAGAAVRPVIRILKPMADTAGDRVEAIPGGGVRRGFAVAP